MLPTFTDESLLITALTHRSALNEGISTSEESNERFEFLGDAVLELASTEFLFAKFPSKPEGELTAFRSALVRTTTLAEAAASIDLGQKLLMSKGEEAGGGRENEGLLANSFEALLGALYLDQGYQAVVSFLEDHLFPKFQTILDEKLYIDAKSLLQETVQAQNHAAPEYRVVAEHGPDHDKTFTVEVLVDGTSIAKGTGRSKQLAQQDAAQNALPSFE